MKILVCFKIISDFSALSLAEWQADDHLKIEMSYLRKMINPFDEAALELALQMKAERDAQDQPTSLFALTISDRNALSFLENLLALSYEDVFLIEQAPKDALLFAPLRIANAIASFSKNKHFDLILFGVEEGEGNHGQTAALVAEKLSLPHIAHATALTAGDTPTSFFVEHASAQGAARWQIATPFAASIGNASAAQSLRQATLKQRILAKERTVNVLPLADFRTEPDAARAPKLRALVHASYAPQENPPPRIQWLTGSVAAQASALLAKWEDA